MNCVARQLEPFPLTFRGTVYGTRPRGDMRLPYEPLGPGDRTAKAEFCVVGSGAGGAIAARNLAKGGHSVVVIESGSYVDPREFDQREATMVPWLYKDGGAQLTMDLSMTVAQGRCLGGSTVINDAICFPPPERVLSQWAEERGLPGLRWPEVRPHVDRIWTELGVSPVPDAQIRGHNRILRDGCNALGIPRHGPNFRNCRNCCECGVCHLGCAYDTKRSMLVTAIPEALGYGANVYANCEAAEVTFRGGRATSVRARILGADGEPRGTLGVTADRVVLAAGAIASSGLLMRSRVPGRLPIGRGVSLHPSPLVMGVFDQPVKGHEAIPMAYHCHEYSVLNDVLDGGYMFESIFLPPMQLAAAMPSLGTQLIRDMRLYQHLAPIGILVRDRPTGEVSLGFQGEPVLDYRVGAPEERTLAKAMARAAEILFAAGAKGVMTSHRSRTILHSRYETDLIERRGTGNDALWMGSAHPQGGNAMGADPQQAVVDGTGRVHGTTNVYVCDASIFPSAVGVNPQITVMALADKISTGLLRS